VRNNDSDDNDDDDDDNDDDQYDYDYDYGYDYDDVDDDGDHNDNESDNDDDNDNDGNCWESETLPVPALRSQIYQTPWKGETRKNSYRGEAACLWGRWFLLSIKKYVA